MKVALHVPSVFVGLVIAGLLGVVMAQQIVGAPGVEVLRVVEPVVVHQPAHPKNFIRIDDTAPYTVPSDRLLVLRTLGWSVNNSVGEIQVRVNGAIVLTQNLGGQNHLGSDNYMFEPGIVAPAGSLVEVHDVNNATAVATVLGYLADN